MSLPENSDPRLDQAAVTDESLLAVHQQLSGKQPDDRGHYRLMPLSLLFIFSGLIFFAGTYLGHYAGGFNPKVYNEHAHGVVTGGGDAPAANPAEVGKKAYNVAGACVTCHQANGLGAPGAIPPLAKSEWVLGSEERLIRVVLYGVQGPIKVAGSDYNSAMPAFGKVAGSGFNWSDDRVAAVLTYIRQEWGNQAGPVTAQKVTEVRTKEGDHKAFTADELLKLP
jgi:mono/diheme cytochrome c family protein